MTAQTIAELFGGHIVSYPFYSIALTGQFKSNPAKIFPANTKPPLLSNTLFKRRVSIFHGTAEATL